MTNPALSINTTEKIGRVYQFPTGNYPKKISGTAARKGITAGELLPSITNVLGVENKNLEGYYAYQTGKVFRETGDISKALTAANDYRDYAARRGTSVHGLIEEYIDYIETLPRESSRTSFPDTFLHLPSGYEVKQMDAMGYARAFTKFARESGAKFLQQESTVYGSTTGTGFNYAGTTDFIAEIDGELVVGDWKCTSKLRNSVALQMAAVRNASHYYNAKTDRLEPWPGDKITKAIAVRLCADGTYEAQAADLETGWANFCHLRALWNNYALEESLLSPVTFGASKK